MIPSSELLASFERHYRRGRNSRRSVRRNDRLYDDLGIDSLLASEEASADLKREVKILNVNAMMMRPCQAPQTSMARRMRLIIGDPRSVIIGPNKTLSGVENR